MKRTLGFVLVLAVVFAFGSAYAQMPSSKVTAGVKGLSVVQASAAMDANGWEPIFTQMIKTPEDKDLFINVSLEVGLSTNTKVMSKQLEKVISTAEAQVKVRVKVGDAYALPNGWDEQLLSYEGVTFSRRAQTLIAKFAGDLTGCLDAEGHVVIDPAGDCVQAEELALILDTLAAHSFVFIAPDVPVGEHLIMVEAKVDYGNDGPQWTEDDVPLTNAYIGNGTVTVDCVRMLKGEIPQL